MYSYVLLFLAGVPLLLGSFWGLAAMLLFVPLLAGRAISEEAMLVDGLDGYREYISKVRFRLIPGIW